MQFITVCIRFKKCLRSILFRLRYQSIPLQFGAHFSLPSLLVGFLPISEMALPSLVSLPMHSYLDDTQQQAMCEFVSAATGNVPIAGPLVS